MSNDNPYSEALFRTLKYVPSSPRQPFESIDTAWAWVERFVAWYNGEHRHSAIGFVTPDERHEGRDVAVLLARREVYARAREQHPARWSGNARHWDAPGSVTLNPRGRDDSARAPDVLRVGARPVTSMVPSSTRHARPPGGARCSCSPGWAASRSDGAAGGKRLRAGPASMLRSVRMTKTPRRWRWVDQDPPEEHGCKPSHVEHEVDFEAMTYVSRACFINPEIWAESETSWSSQHYEIERSAAGWMIRLVGRNHAQLDSPHAWEPAPPALASAWDAAVLRTRT